MSMSLAPHPVGIKFWTGLWKDNKDLPYAEIHKKFQNWYGHTFQRNFGRYFYAHRCGMLGSFAPMVVFMLGFKVACMYACTLRDLGAAQETAAAYGQAGYKTNPVPKEQPQEQRQHQQQH
eukprot:CAMPEP_0172798880 /NCGR_PEP_ID=MMETSP1075-20121228/1463_1 /TAXON_ID=2916 /ORGANISM="Ceratium fusus, Strain PA161109" /LENGTH=119 /DNA_ID=CAMNT_0013636441 /DNA_START=33 /DNA_END=390 /DNA_ORIENTATION=+